MRRDVERLLDEVMLKRLKHMGHLDEATIASMPEPAFTELDRALLSEFLQTGLGPDDEPNSRGIALENLLDVIHAIRRGRIHEDG